MQRSPERTFVINDLIRNRATSILLALLLILSAFLMATGAMVLERLFGSVDRLFEEARPPHFLQMHTGDYDRDALDRFASTHPQIEAWQISSMLGFDGAELSWAQPDETDGSEPDASGTFSDSLVDNLFIAQNEEFDFLIDESGAVPQPAVGEVYVPVAYQQRYGLQADDELRIGTGEDMRTLRIEGFVRDSQMASSLSSGTRFLISPDDFRELESSGRGAPEIIIEYRLDDAAAAADLQRAYESDDTVPRNGQAVTYTMIRVINAFSDGVVGIVLMLISLLLIAIAFLSLRFMIRGTLEDEVRQIGTMKAIGIPDRTITGLYLHRYRLLTAGACLVGGALAVGAAAFLTRGAQTNYAEARIELATFVTPLAALGLVYLVVILICRAVLRAVRRIEVVRALVHGSTLTEHQAVARRTRRKARGVRRIGLDNHRSRSSRGLTTRLALIDLRADGTQWILIPIVFALATVLMVLPANLHSTFASPRFVTYMGAPAADLRIDLQFADDVDPVREDLLTAMHTDARLGDVRPYARVLHEMRGEDGWETLPVDVGEQRGSDTDRGLEYLRGVPPERDEIALSVLNAEQHGLDTGDTLALRRGGTQTEVTVSGVYQDVTSGGRTAKMAGEVASGAAGYVVYATVADGVDPAVVAAEYGERFPVASVIPFEEYVRQTLSYVTEALSAAAVIAAVLGLGTAALITTLFLRLRLVRERARMGILRAVGFSTREISAQVRGKTLATVMAGTLIGLAVAATAGESFLGFLLALTGLGIAELSFIPNPWLVFLAYPLALITVGWLAAVALTSRLRGTDTSELLR